VSQQLTHFGSAPQKQIGLVCQLEVIYGGGNSIFYKWIWLTAIDKFGTSSPFQIVNIHYIAVSNDSSNSFGEIEPQPYQFN
jgi:hypothetical protein